ncbi:MAG: PEP-CTERM sorting domain-containing protein [Gallionellaceae bacterium]|nr:PEP-CTERM sorting domain-containing protein [Gallionellaceae bacterium]
MNKRALISVLLLAFGPTSAALAVPYQITYYGTFNDSISGTYDSSFDLDFSAWAGKSFTMSWMLDTDPTKAVGGTYNWPDPVGNVDHYWTFGPSQYQISLVVDGVTVLPGNSFDKNEIGTMNNQFIPDYMAAPHGVTEGYYDSLHLETDHHIGCQGGAECTVDPTQVSEGLSMGVDYVWNDLNQIPNDNMPDLLNAAPAFDTSLLTRIYLEGGRWSPSGVDEVVYSLDGQINSYTIAAVPEPETYAMLMAGLGFIGWRNRRRRRA